MQVSATPNSFVVTKNRSSILNNHETTKKQCLHVKSIRQISQRDKKATNIQINKKNQKKYEAGLSDKNKGKENKIGKAPDS